MSFDTKELVFRRKDGKALTKQDFEDIGEAFYKYCLACEAAGMELIDDD